MPDSNGSRPRPPEGRDHHGERHPGGWRVRPGPDGRGAPPPPRQRIFGPGFLIFFVVLLLINVVLASTVNTTTTQPRVAIPFSPTFLAQVDKGNVASISSTVTAVQGTIRTALRYP